MDYYCYKNYDSVTQYTRYRYLNINKIKLQSEVRDVNFLLPAELDRKHARIETLYYQDANHVSRTCM